MLTQVGAQDAAAKVRFSWVFAVASVGPFMAALDNLMVTTALPMIMKPPRTPACQRRGWLVNAHGIQAVGHRDDQVAAAGSVVACGCGCCPARAGSRWPGLAGWSAGSAG
jgi:hypothetical protein